MQGLRLLYPLLFVFYISARCYGQEMMIYTDGKNDFSIITRANPSGLEKSAASERQYHLKKVG